MASKGSPGRDFSDEDGLDEFEESAEEDQRKRKNETTYNNKPYDEAVEFSQDLSVAESFDGRQKNASAVARDRQLKNDKYDEAVDVSQSMDQSAVMGGARPGAGAKGQAPASVASSGAASSAAAGKQPAASTASEEKTNSYLNKPFDEALEFSQSSSGESIDTRGSQRPKKASADAKQSAPVAQQKPAPMQALSAKASAPAPQQQQAAAALNTSHGSDDVSGDDDEDEGSDEGGAGNAQTLDNIEGAYNPQDYAHLNVSAEIRDLFQYIERYKVQTVEIETTLKCFIPDYIPSIGEMDAFIKVPRPDGKDDELGLKRLDEPAAIQSDPTVLELQLRAMSKKQQYGDVAVRSIENAEKNPAAIEKWVTNINNLHRSKPPPQVHYHRNMPEIEALMEVWPERFEEALSRYSLPPPDLDLSLPEYVRILCSVLDIPVYENPIESLHVMFTLFSDFRNNPHFQALRAAAAADNGGPQARGQAADFGGADVFQLGDYK